MRSEENTFYREGETYHLVRRYERMRREKTRYYFDVHEFEDIIDYYLDMNKTGSASLAIKCGLTQHPESTGIQVRKANVLIDKGSPGKALKLLYRLSAIESSNYEIYVSLGTALNMLGKTDEAVQYFDQALTLDPEDKDEVAGMIGFSFQDAGNFADAVRYFKLAYKLSGNRESFLYEIGYCYEQLGEFENAVHLYEKYLDYDPFYETGWYNLGVVYSKTGDFAAALTAFDYSIALNEKNSSAIFNKANVLVSMNKYYEAIEAFKEFLVLEKDDLNGLLYLAECYDNIGEEKMAKKYYRKAGNIDPDSPDLFFGLGMLELKKKNFDDSREYFKKALTMDNENPEFWYALTKTFELQENKLNAIETALKAIHYDPYEPEYWMLAARLYAETGVLGESVNTLQKALNHLEDEPVIHYMLGIYLILSNKSSKAYKHIEKGFETDFDLHKDAFKNHPWIMSLKKVKFLIDKYKNRKNKF